MLIIGFCKSGVRNLEISGYYDLELSEKGCLDLTLKPYHLYERVCVMLGDSK